ncbi:MAG: hypothetical protein JO181_12240, partial [Solirubrobacterales bacterium]|nr:hypothetical protein [Solirubrobacterales bacterium]
MTPSPTAGALLIAYPRANVTLSRNTFEKQPRRQAEALAAYRAARSALVDELGIEPSVELRQLHEAI